LIKILSSFHPSPSLFHILQTVQCPPFASISRAGILFDAVSASQAVSRKHCCDHFSFMVTRKVSIVDITKPRSDRSPTCLPYRTRVSYLQSTNKTARFNSSRYYPGASQ
jgi:hypothetical protein